MWGDVDLVWSIIFIIIVIALVYWAIIIFTRDRVVPFEFLPTTPQNADTGADDDEIDGRDLLGDELLEREELFFEDLIYIL